MLSNDEKLKHELLAQQIMRLDQIRVAEEEQLRTSEIFDEICIRLGFVASTRIKQILSKITGIRYVNLKDINIAQTCTSIFSKEVQRERHFTVFEKIDEQYPDAPCNKSIIPDAPCNKSVRQEPDAQRNKSVIPDAQRTIIKVAMVDPMDLGACDYITRQLLALFGTDTVVVVEFFYADNDAIEALLTSGADDGNVSAPDATGLFNTILTKAIACGASDVHIQPMLHLVCVRARVDGILRTIHEIHRNIWPNLVIRIKMLANLDIAESRRPQSGHFDWAQDTQKFDFRVSTHPTIHGENIVIRILHKNKKILDLDTLGISPQISDKLLDIIKRPYGMILLCGPTGSGKTTTLYALCSHMDAVSRNIMTLEEPVEYQMDNVRQTEIQANGVLSFADGVRSILRQDPDVIFIGEIRDEETANIALRAAMTGHLVLSTIHSNDALRAPSRLFDLGIKPALLSGQIVAIMSQRLLRCVCNECGGGGGGGCPSCSHSGYKGRTAICELLVVDDDIDSCISSQRPIGELAACAEAHGYVSMLDDGMQKVRNNVTTLAELRNVLGPGSCTGGA